MSLISPRRKRKRSRSCSEDEASNIELSLPLAQPEQILPIHKSPPHLSLRTPDRSPWSHAFNVTESPPPTSPLSSTGPSADTIDLPATPTPPQSARPRSIIILLVTVVPLNDLHKQSLHCPICFEDYSEYIYTKNPIPQQASYPVRLDFTITRGARTPLCGHIFSRNCLEKYLEGVGSRNSHCPICNTALHFSSEKHLSCWCIVPRDLWMPRTYVSLPDFDTQSLLFLSSRETVQMLVDAYGIEDLAGRLEAQVVEVLRLWDKLRRDQKSGARGQEMHAMIGKVMRTVGLLDGR